MTISYLVLAVALGAAVSIYLPMISKTSQMMGSPFLGNIPFFGMALLASVLMAVLTGSRLSDLSKFATVPFWLFMAGVIGALAILGASFLVPRIGTGVLFVLIVAGQVVFGALVSHYGLFGVPEKPITLLKSLGIVFVIAGAAIVSFGSDSR